MGAIPEIVLAGIGSVGVLLQSLGWSGAINAQTPLIYLRRGNSGLPVFRRDNVFYRVRSQAGNSLKEALKEAQILTERWRVEYNTERPHSALGYRPPAPAACTPTPALNPVSQLRAVM